MLHSLIYHELDRFTNISLFWWRRVAFIGLLMFFLFNATGESSQIGLTFIRECSWALCYLFIVLAPLSCSWSINEEKKKNTLGILLLTELTAGKIIFGKLFSRMLVMVFYLASSIPIFFIIMPFGGISLFQIIHIFVALVATILFSGAIGVLVAVSTNSKAYTSAVVNVVIYSTACQVRNFKMYILSYFGTIRINDFLVRIT